MKKIFRFLVCFALLGLTAANVAAFTPIDWTQSGSIRAARFNMADSVAAGTIRGILIFGNGAGGNSLSAATNAELVAWAESMKFAVIGTSEWGYFDAQAEIDLWYSMIQYFATQTGHPELVKAPWLPVGHSNGGQMSFGFNSFDPAKTIGFITTKGQFYRTNSPSPLALRTPGMLTSGTADSTARQDAIKKLFTINRPRGALWAWINEQGVGHDDTFARNMTYPFMEECVRLRYPADQQPSASYQPVLKDLIESDGWLVGDDTADWTTGYTPIKAAQDETGNIRSWGWVPNKRMAYIYRAYSSYNKVGSVTSNSTGGSGTPQTATVVTAPNTLNFQVSLTNGSWSSIEFFEGDESLGTVAPGGPNGNSPKTSKAVQYGGYYVFYGVVTKTDNTKACTPLRRVFVKGPSRPTAFDTWAAANLPSGSQGAVDDPQGVGVANVTRYGAGLGTGANPDKNRLPQFTGFIQQGSTEYAEYKYKFDAAARESGLNVMPSYSNDLMNWKRCIPGEGSYVTYARSGDDVTVRIPVAVNSTSKKILVEFGDTYQTGSAQDPSNTWNSMMSTGVGGYLDLVDSANGITGLSMTVTRNPDPSITGSPGFTGVNGQGQTNSNGIYPTSATRESFYFDNGREPRLELAGLDPANTYSFKIAGYRNDGATNPIVRSTKFTVTGTNSGSGVQNATNNTTGLVQINGITPTSQGIITIDMEEDAVTNTSTSGVGYLSVIEINATAPFAPDLPGKRLFFKLDVDDRTY